MSPRLPRLAVATSAALPELDPDSRGLLDALSARGVAAAPAVWTDPQIDWAGFDAVLVRSVWDYFHRPAAWARWVDRVAATTELINPPALLRWNAHKGYLRELARSGVPVVATSWLRPGDPLEGDALAWAADAIVKPAVDGGAERLHRVRGEATLRKAVAGLLGEGHEVMIQPFLPSVPEEGELSLLYFGGELSHAVRKRARPGDIRVQPSWGGSYAREAPSGEALAVAEATLRALPEAALYARVDLVRERDGGLALIELEAIEPLLFLEAAPEAAGRLADVIAGRLRAR